MTCTWVPHPDAERGSYTATFPPLHAKSARIEPGKPGSYPHEPLPNAPRRRRRASPAIGLDAGMSEQRRLEQFDQRWEVLFVQNTLTSDGKVDPLARGPAEHPPRPAASTAHQSAPDGVYVRGAVRRAGTPTYHAGVQVEPIAQTCQETKAGDHQQRRRGSQEALLIQLVQQCLKQVPDIPFRRTQRRRLPDPPQR
jgi:hypothetical protein